MNVANISRSTPAHDTGPVFQRTRLRQVIAGVLVVVVFGVVARQTGIPWVGEALYVLVLTACLLVTSRRILVAAAASLALMVASESSLVPGMLNTLAPSVVVWLIAAAFLLERRAFRVDLVVASVLALAAVATAATALAQGPGDGLRVAIIALMWVAAVCAGAEIVRAGDARRLAAFALSLGLALVIIVAAETLLGDTWFRTALLANADGDYIVRANTILGDWINRGQATLGYPIPLSLLLAICLVVTLVSAQMRPIVRLTLGGVYAAGILLTGTRSALVVVAVGTAAYLISRLLNIRRDHPRRAEWVPPTVLAALAGGASAVFLIRSILAKDFSLTHRTGMVDTIIQSIADRNVFTLLMGGGRGAVAQAIAEGALITDGHGAVDNTFAFVLFSYGALGLIALLTAAVVALLRGGHLLRALVAAMLAGFAFLDGVEWHALAYVFFLLLGVGSVRKTAAPGPAAVGKEHLEEA